MKLVQKQIIHGFKPLLQSKDGNILFSQGRKLLLYNIAERKMEHILDFPAASRKESFAFSSMFRRVLRLYAHCAQFLDEDRVLVARKEGVYRVDLRQKEYYLEERFQFRPLSFTEISGVKGFDDGIYFGEYGPNKDRNPMSIWYRSPQTQQWSKVFTFPQGTLEHFHTLVPDPEKDCVWILVGDYRDAPAIYQAKNNFQEVEAIVKGKQDYRSCVAFPTKEGLVYATDSHLEINSIRVVQPSAEGWESTSIMPMVGSCIYGTRLNKHFFFSTSAEPGEPTGNYLLDLLDPRQGEGVLGDHLQIVMGNLEEGFHVLKRFKTDLLPKRLFQFSTIFFPDTHPDAKHLVFWCVGVEGFHDQTFILEVVD